LGCALLAALVGVCAEGCSSRDSAPPVATVSFVSSKPRIALGSPVDFTYRFDVAPGTALTDNYRVFVHIVDAYGNPMPWTDDHDPEVPTSQWKPGQTIQYTRTLFVPVYPYLGTATIEVGLYKDTQRLPLQGPDPADRGDATRSYKVGTVEFLPQNENIFLGYSSGWHPAESAPDNPSIQWQWTQKSAVLTIHRNPKRDVTLFLDFDARTDLFPDRPQEVTILAGDQVVEKFPADNNSARLRRIAISAAQLGPKDTAELRIEVDRTFVPARLAAGGRDNRELGLRVYHVFVENR
jgi:hypothetical protein